MLISQNKLQDILSSVITFDFKTFILVQHCFKCHRYLNYDPRQIRRKSLSTNVRLQETNSSVTILNVVIFLSMRTPQSMHYTLNKYIFDGDVM